MAAGGLAVLVGASVLLPPLVALVRDHQKSAEFTANTGQLVVESLEPLTITKQAGVLAVIRNNGAQKSRPDRITLTIQRESKVLFTCQVAAVAFIAPAGTATEQLICHEVDRSAVPVGATYKLHIAGAWNSK